MDLTKHKQADLLRDQAKYLEKIYNLLLDDRTTIVIQLSASSLNSDQESIVIRGEPDPNVGNAPSRWDKIMEHFGLTDSTKQHLAELAKGTLEIVHDTYDNL